MLPLLGRLGKLIRNLAMLEAIGLPNKTFFAAESEIARIRVAKRPSALVGAKRH